MPIVSLADIAKHRKPVSEVLAGLQSDSTGTSVEAGKKLVQKAQDAGLNLRDYLTLAVDVRAGEGEDKGRYEGLNGYEAALAHLNLPFKNDLENGVVLQAAADSFGTYPGTRAMFPEVLDDMLRQQGRIESIENVASLVGNTRTITQTEMISTVLNDTAGEDDTFTISEFGKIPVRTVGTSQTAVRMFKHGSGYEFSYEFNRRASLDIITPFASRVARRLEKSKVSAATYVLVNGDGVNPAATATTLGAYGGDFTGGKSLKDNYRALAKFLMEKWKAGYPIDTLACNFDTYVELMFMFTPTLNSRESLASAMPAVAGTPNINLPVMNGSVNVVLSSAVAADRIVAFVKGETLEELQEAGSNIAESERSITSQSVTYVRSAVSGFKLAFGDTRWIINTAA